jgi:tetratricopeptide (TPR) repeat protein
MKFPTDNPRLSFGASLGFGLSRAMPLLAGIFLGLFLVVDAGRNMAVGVHNPALGPAPNAVQEDGQEEKLSSALKLAPSLARLHATLGGRAFAKGEFEKARRAYHEAVTRNPLHGPFHRELGLALFRLNRIEEADSEMILASRLHRANPDLQFKVGTYFLLLRAYPPTQGRIVVDENTILKRNEMLRQANLCFRRAARLDLAYLDRAIDYYQTCRPDPEALADVVPPTKEALARFAGFLAKQKSYKAAAGVWDRLLQGPWAVEPPWRLEAARAELLAGNAGTAEAHILKAAQSDELTADQVAFVARMYIAAKKYFEGIQALNAVRGYVRPDRSRIYTQIGKLWWAMGRLSSAAGLFEKGALQSHDPEAYYHLALIADMAHDSHSAERYYRQAIRGNRENHGYRYKLGLLFQRENRTSDAITEIEEAIRLAPGVKKYRDKLFEIMEKWKSG